MNKIFKDYFSDLVENYSTFRPQYPENLFKYLAEISPSTHFALDCATGSGQSAISLANYFNQILAIDSSQKQLNQAIHHDKIVYQVGMAENLPVENHSLDLITVAQALHWFDLEQFYQEVRRVLKPNGLLVAWTYNLLTFENPQLNKLIAKYYNEIVGKYWAEERKSVELGYQNLDFPFEKIVDKPKFHMSAEWNLKHLIGYLGTWSATTLFKKNEGYDPRTFVLEDFANAWHDDPNQTKTVTWELSVLIGRV